MSRRSPCAARHRSLVLLLAAAALLTGGCNSRTASLAAGVTGVQQAPAAQAAAMRDWQQCHDDALTLDRQARQQGMPARNLASARLIEDCEAELGPVATGPAAEARMRAYALAIQNRLKGGDVARARRNLQAFRVSFVDGDLYYSDGASFIDTMEALLDLRAYGRREARLNGALRAELRRVRYWQGD